MKKQRPKRPTRENSINIRRSVNMYIENRKLFEQAAQNIYSLIKADPQLNEYIHFIKYRVKDHAHLKDKLRRKAISARENDEEFEITPDNIFKKISDLVGVRVLHLHTNQIKYILPRIQEILLVNQYNIVENPFAYTWDNETKELFEEMNIDTQYKQDLYTSVHLVVEVNKKTHIRCEIQIRTLMEEVWGEVSHMVNYPKESNSVACREQLKVLARVSSSCTRLVDSIFSSFKEYQTVCKD